MNKFRNAIEEGKFAARVARQFFRSYRKWRDSNPDEDVVYVYVGHPDMAATIVRQSPLWQRFAELEANMDVQRAAAAMADRARDLVNVRCNCAACTASRATREESKAYDA